MLRNTNVPPNMFNPRACGNFGKHSLTLHNYITEKKQYLIRQLRSLAKIWLTLYKDCSTSLRSRYSSNLLYTVSTTLWGGTVFKNIQYNLDLVTSNLVTTCDLVIIFHWPFFNLPLQIIRFSDIMWFSDSFWRYQKWD